MTTVNLNKTRSTLLKASSVVTLMGWAAIGKEYANADHKDAPSCFDYANAARVVSDMLENVCGELEIVESGILTTKATQGGEK